MEVPGRPTDAPRQLSSATDRAWALRWAALAAAGVVALAVLVVTAQPIRSPWWTYADADGSYAAAALNLVSGDEVTFVDHPGLPLTEAVALAFDVETLLEERSLSKDARLAFVDRSLRDLDMTRGTFRGLAAFVYLLGALLSFVLAARIFGHWTWGLASGVLWIAAPGLVAMSIQLRPDVALAVLALVFGFAVARAVEQRSAEWYAAAAATVGFAAMVKLHALALLPALAVAAVWRPADVGGVTDRARRWIGAHEVAVAAIASVWLLAAVLLNAGRLPWTITRVQLGVLAALLVAVAVWVVLAELLGRPFYGLLALAFAGGLLLPVTLDVPDGLRALHDLARSLTGRGVQSDVDSFATPLSSLDNLVGREAVLVFLIAALAGALGVVRRDPRPVVWSVGALSMGAMAFARPPNVHYFAPTYVLALLALLWLLQRRPRAPAPLLVWPLVALLVWPAWDGREAPAAEQKQLASSVAGQKRYVDGALRPGEIVLVPSSWPFEDSRYFEFVNVYAARSPDDEYRSLPTTTAAQRFARERGLRPRFYVGPESSDLAERRRVLVGDFGEYTLVPTSEPGVAELVDGPGVTGEW